MVVLSREFVSQPVDALEILHAFHQAVCHLLLTGTQRHARIVVLLVGLVLAIRVANLRPEQKGAMGAPGSSSQSFKVSSIKSTAVPNKYHKIPSM